MSGRVGASAAAVPSAVQGGSARAPEPVNASQGDGEREGKGSVHGAKERVPDRCRLAWSKCAKLELNGL